MKRGSMAGMSIPEPASLSSMKREAAVERVKRLRVWTFICLLWLFAPSFGKFFGSLLREGRETNWEALFVLVPTVAAMVMLKWAEHVERKLEPIPREAA